MRRIRIAAKHTLLLILALPAGGAAIAQQTDAAACIENFDPATDYYPDKTDVIYAENFSVSYHLSYKVVTVAQPFVGGASQTYVLVHCGAPVPTLDGDLAAAPVIVTPVQSVFSASTTHNPMFDALNAVDRITGVATLAYTANQAVLDAAAAGHIIEFASTGALDAELVIDAAPDIFLTGGGDDPLYDVLRSAGIRIVADAEWLEPNILGRAEWIKYVALFLDAEALAGEVFAAVEASYLDAAATVAGVSDRPIVLAGSSFQGVFYAPGGRSYVAQTIAAAGGRYVFDNNPDTSSIAFADLEQVLDVAGDADFWVNSAIAYRTVADIEADEPRLARIPAVVAGQVWNYDLLNTPSGGVGFFELGVLRPDLVLRDLIEIFHPGTLPDHQFTFYRPVSFN